MNDFIFFIYNRVNRGLELQEMNLGINNLSHELVGDRSECGNVTKTRAKKQ